MKSSNILNTCHTENNNSLFRDSKDNKFYFEEKVRQLKQDYLEGRNGCFGNNNRSKSPGNSISRICMTEFSPKLSASKILPKAPSNEYTLKQQNKEIFDNPNDSVDTFSTELMFSAAEAMNQCVPTHRATSNYTKIFIPVNLFTPKT